MVLRLGGRIAEYPQSVTSWTDKIEWLVESIPHRELDRIDGEPVVFEWKIIPGLTTLKLLREVHNMMEKKLNVLPRDFKDRIIFMSMYSDIDLQVLPNMRKVFPEDVGHALACP